MILVVGATGLLGGTITRKLLERAHPVRILVRDGSDHQPLVDAGAEPVPGDLKDPASLRAACEGVDAVVTTANSILRGGADTVESVDRAGNQNLVAAAADAGVERFVFVSVIGADAAAPDPFMSAKGQAEEVLRASGMRWTALRPLPFMDIWVAMVVAAPALQGQPVTVIGEGRRRHSMIAVRDVADYAVAALENPQAEGQTLVLGGPEPITWRDAVAEVGQALGRDVELRTVGPGDPVPGIPPAMLGLLAFLDTYDSPVDMTELAATYGVPGTSLREFVTGLVVSRQVQPEPPLPV